MKKVFFPNLNELRFFAALIVLIHHVEQIKNVLGMPSYWNNASILIMGKLGVILFFVLSGFLITYLLLAEEEQTGEISIKDFYLRRILRIWPLYYLIVLLSFFIIPSIGFLDIPNLTEQLIHNFWIKLGLFTVFLPNLSLILFAAVPYASQLWSVGVEEIFYILWPALIKKCKRRYRLLIGIIVLYVFFKLLLIFQLRTEHTASSVRVLSSFWDVFNIDCMAIGGVFSLLLFYKSRFLKILFHPIMQIAVLVVLAIFIGKGFKVPYLHEEVYSVLFGVFILNIAANPKRLFGLQNRVMNYLGKISYGIYMFHSLAIVIALKLLAATSFNSLLFQYAGSIIITVALASFSFKYYESFFIKKKAKFSRIQSGDEASEKNIAV